MAIYKFKIVKVEEVTTKDNNKFLTYKTVDKRGNFLDVKFRRAVKNAPTERCVVVVNDEDNWNIDEQRQYPVLWIAQVDAIEPYPASKGSNKRTYFDPET